MNRIFNHKGYALAIVLFVMAIVSISGAVLLSTGSGDYRFAIHEDDRVKAYYMAKSGVEAAAAHMVNPAKTLAQINTIVTTNTVDNNSWTTFEDGRFKIYFGGDKYTPVIKSVGEYNSTQQQMSMKLKKKYFFDAAVAVTNSLILANNSDVFGDVTTTLDPAVAIPNNQDNITGTISQDPRVYPSPTDPGLTPSALPWPPPGNTITSSSGYANAAFGDVDLNNTDITIILNGDMKLKFNSFKTKAGINVIGDGLLQIYTNTIEYKGSLDSADDTKVILNIFDSGTLDFQTGNSTFEGFIYGPNANMTISANVDSVGAIVAKNLTLSSGGNVTYSSATGNVYPEDVGQPSLGYDRDIVLDDL